MVGGYSPYGTPTCEGSATTPLGFDAQYTNTDTGLIYMRARTYDPSTAQFLTRDPWVAPALNDSRSRKTVSPRRRSSQTSRPTLSISLLFF
jgi:RHS repeat-associated protein